LFINPDTLAVNLDLLEAIERASLRLVVQALIDFRDNARTIFATEGDFQADIGEDITREALDSMGVSRIPARLFGKMDYKKAQYFFHPDYAVRQALFVDSKAEQGALVARLQTSQTSMRIRQIRARRAVDVPGTLPTVITVDGVRFITTTVFVKYDYRGTLAGNQLRLVRLACLPNGMLQDRYNPTAQDSIWLAGPNAPARGEEFRTRLSFNRLKQKATWRVQDIHIDSDQAFEWCD